MKKSAAKRLANIMRNEAHRAVGQIRPRDHARPFYLSFLVRDEESWEFKASYGSMISDSHGRKRNCYCDVRVGSHQYDQMQGRWVAR